MRTAIVTGAGRGVGLATTELLASRGYRVVGVDLAGADIDADLSSPEGRAAMEQEVRSLCPDGIDVIVANAGVFNPDTMCLKVNYFGAVETLERLRPLLRGPAPRAVVVSSRTVVVEVDHELVEACLSGDEKFAVDLAEQKLPEAGPLLYSSSKRAVARWMRRSAPSDEWAGQGIALNAVGPGAIETPLIADLPAAEKARLIRERPMPLGGIARPEEIAEVIAFLASPQNSKMSGQLLIVDGAGENLMCSEDIWDGMLR